MLPMKALRLELGTALAADATYLAPAVSANKIALIKTPFVPSETMVAGDVTPADFTGSTALAGSTGAQLVGVDPSTGQQLITIKEPLGGWRWITTNTVNLPQTIYGYGLYDSTLATLLAVALLPAPVALTETGQQVDIGRAAINFVLQPMN
jgi:hypothetical protein